MPITKMFLRKLIKSEFETALPERKDQRRKDRGPIWAWIRSANSANTIGSSRIALVTGEKVKWQWRAWNASGLILFESLCANHHITWIQKEMLVHFIQRKYPGHMPRDKYSIKDDFYFKHKNEWAIRCQNKTEDFVKEQIEKICEFHKAPLRLILSPTFTVAINLKFMEYYK